MFVGISAMLAYGLKLILCTLLHRAAWLFIAGFDFSIVSFVKQQRYKFEESIYCELKY